MDKRRPEPITDSLSILEEISREAGAITRYTLRFSIAVVIVGLALSIGAGLLGVTGGPVMFVCSLLLALIMALFAVGLALFRVVQIRTLELLLLVAVLGNALGWIYRAMGDTAAVSVGGRVTLALIIGLPCLVWTLGGAAWGLWVAKELLIDRPAHRLWLVATGLLTPLAFGCAVASIPVGAIVFPTMNGLLAGLCVLMFFVSFAVLIYAVRLHLRVLKEISDSGGQDEL